MSQSDKLLESYKVKIMSDNENADMPQDETQLEEAAQITPESGSAVDEQGSENSEAIAEPPAEKPKTVPLGTHVHKQNKLKDQLKAKEKEQESVAERLEIAEQELRLHRMAQETQEPETIPDSLDYDSDEEYQEAMTTWSDKRSEKKAMEVFDQRQKQLEQQQIAQQQADKLSSSIDDYTKQATDFGADDFDVIQQKVIDSLGQANVTAIIQDFDDPVKIIYALGGNELQLNNIKSLISSGSGNKALISLSQFASGLTTTQKNVNTPEPDEPIKGGAGAVSDMQKNLDRLRKRADNGEISRQEVMKYRKEMREAGFAPK